MTTIPDNAIVVLLTQEHGLKKGDYRNSLKIYSELLGIKETSVERLLSCIYQMMGEELGVKMGSKPSRRYRDAYEQCKTNGVKPGNHIQEIIQQKLDNIANKSNKENRGMEAPSLLAAEEA